jgi:hypothetical protein
MIPSHWPYSLSDPTNELILLQSNTGTTKIDVLAEGSLIGNAINYQYQCHVSLMSASCFNQALILACTPSINPVTVTVTVQLEHVTIGTLHTYVVQHRIYVFNAWLPDPGGSQFIAQIWQLRKFSITRDRNAIAGYNVIRVRSSVGKLCQQIPAVIKIPLTWTKY